MAFIYRHRNVPASAAACAVVALAIYSQTHRFATPKRENIQEPVQVSLVEPPPPPAPIPPPPAPTPPTPAPPRPTPPAPAPKVVEQPRPVQAPSPETIPTKEPTPPPPPPTPAPPPPPPPPPAPAPPPPPSVDVNAVYTGKVRAYLNSIKRYPTSREASLQRPEGTVRVWFILRRDGSLVDAGIEDSSNSILLDNAGLATVRRGTLPAFEGSFGSDEQHRFTVDLSFKATS
jgi:periplasmic protein TonB